MAKAWGGWDFRTAEMRRVCLAQARWIIKLVDDRGMLAHNLEGHMLSHLKGKCPACNLRKAVGLEVEEEVKYADTKAG